MENAKHTPGPWEVFQDRGSSWPLVMSGGPAGKIIANINPESCPDASSAPCFVVMPAEANARLIASAPDLLEAAKNILEECDFDEDSGTYPITEKALVLLTEAVHRAINGEMHPTDVVERQTGYE